MTAPNAPNNIFGGAVALDDGYVPPAIDCSKKITLRNVLLIVLTVVSLRAVLRVPAVRPPRIKE